MIKCFKKTKDEKMYRKPLFYKFFYPFELLYYIVCNFFNSFTFRKYKNFSIEEIQKEIEF